MPRRAAEDEHCDICVDVRPKTTWQSAFTRRPAFFLVYGGRKRVQKNFPASSEKDTRNIRFACSEKCCVPRKPCCANRVALLATPPPAPVVLKPQLILTQLLRQRNIATSNYAPVATTPLSRTRTPSRRHDIGASKRLFITAALLCGGCGAAKLGVISQSGVSATVTGGKGPRPGGQQNT